MTDLRDRDDVIDRWLRRASSAPGPGPNAACLDAEVMAAWADGGLPDAALEAVRAHVADCSRCQVLAAVMTKLEPAAVAAPARSSSPRWLNWLVPLAAVAGAVAIWVFIPRPSPEFPQPAASAPPASQMAQAPAADPAAAVPAPSPKREDAAASKPAPPKLKAEQQGAAKLQANEKDQFREAQATRAEAARDRAQTQPTDPKKADTRIAAAPSPPPPPAAPPPAVVGAAQAVLPPPPAAVAQGTANRTVAGGGGRGGGGGQGAGGGQRVSEVADSRLSKEIVSLDQATRWRISDRVVEKSTDGGRSWSPVKTGVTTPLTAGSSPSPTTCWLVGQRGVILLTTDGETWRRITFSEETDLSAVRATDARTATVTTLDGREYSTTDGGNTWIRR